MILFNEIAENFVMNKKASKTYNQRFVMDLIEISSSIFKVLKCYLIKCAIHNSHFQLRLKFSRLKCFKY